MKAGFLDGIGEFALAQKLARSCAQNLLSQIMNTDDDDALAAQGEAVDGSVLRGPVLKNGVGWRLRKVTHVANQGQPGGAWQIGERGGRAVVFGADEFGPGWLHVISSV